MKSKKTNTRNKGCFPPLAVVVAAIIALIPFFYQEYRANFSIEKIVVLYSMTTVEEAIQKAKEIRKQGFPAEVYRSQNGYFAVTLGPFPKKEANSMQIKVIRNYMGRRDTFLGDPKKYLLKVYP